MSWQSPAFNPSRAKLWKGGFTRILGCVSDGVTDTFGLRQWCDAYMVMYDSVVMDPQHYSLIHPRLILSTVPPEGTWIEVIGIGVVSDVPTDSTRWVRGTFDEIRQLADHISIGTSNRFVWDHLPDLEAETSSGSVYHPGKNRVYSMPQDAGTIYEIDVEGRNIEEVSSPHLDFYEPNKFAGAFMRSNGKIYGIPDGASYVPEFDPETGKSRMIPIEYFENEPVWTDRMFSCGVVLDDFAIGIPFDAHYFIVVNLLTGETSQSTLGLTEEQLSVPGKWDGVAYDAAGNAYCAPYNSDAVLKIAPDLTATIIEIDVGDPTKASKYRGCCIPDDGNLYFSPFNADHILCYEIAGDRFVEIDVPELHGKRFQYWGCAHTSEQMIVFAPHDARAVMFYDCWTSHVSFPDMGDLVDIVDRDFAFVGAWNDPFGKVHLSAYQAPCDIIVDVDDTMRAWRQDSRPDFHSGGDRPTNIGGASDFCGVAMFLPWRDNNTTPWTVNGTNYVVDSLVSGLPIISPLTEKQGKAHWYFGDELYREITGVLDLGDIRFQMQDDGDIWRNRVSGLELFARIDTSTSMFPDEPNDREEIYADVAWPLDTDWHYPRFTWARNKAFYGLESTNNDTEMVSLPNSQTFYVFRPKKFLRAATPYVKLTGMGRDQWYTDSVMGADGFIWSIPYNSPHIMYFDKDRETTHLGTYGMDLRDRRKWRGAVRAGRYIFGTPYDRNTVLVIDAQTDTIYETDFGLNLEGKAKFLCGVYRDGKVIMVPCNFNKFLVIDVASMTATLDDFGLPDSVMNLEAKWGACGVNQSDQIVCGPLGIGTSARKTVWIDPDMTGNVYAGGINMLYGIGGSMYINGNLIFRLKASAIVSTFKNYVVPAVMPANGALGAYRTNLPKAFQQESLYVIDHWVYGLTDTLDFVYSVAVEDWSTYNERYDIVPGVRPWIGLPPAALQHYETDEFSMYGEGCRSFRKEALWNDPIYVGNNTAYAINCNGGVICRCTVESYNHFREYLRETNNHESSYKGAIQHEGKIWPVPSSIPLMDVIDQSTKQIERVYVEPPPNWRGFDMFKGGTVFQDKFVYYPGAGFGANLYFTYYDPVAKTWEYNRLPDELYVTDGWREWLRVDDTIWGIPHNADYFLIWDMATKTATKFVPADTKNWGNKLWSDGIHWRRDSSHSDREVTWLLPYNSEKVASMRAWGKDAQPTVDDQYFDSSFPGLKKWSCWASPTERSPLMYGVPENAEGILKLDVRGGEPTVSDYGITLDQGWSQEEKWLSCVNHTINGREFAIFIPYNARDVIAIDWATGRVYKVAYNGVSLAGTRKWIGGWSHGDRVFCVPYDANGLLELRFTVVGDGDTLAISAVGSSATYGLNMSGMAKWRGCVFLNMLNYGSAVSIWVAVCIPANSNRFAAFYFNKGGAGYQGYPPGGPDSNPYSSQLLQIGITAADLEGTDKWAPRAAQAAPSPELERPGDEYAEYMFPAWNHSHTLRVTVNMNLPQAFVVPHRQPAARRGWVPTSFHKSWGKGGGVVRAWSIPWTCGTYLMHNGSEVDQFEAGIVMERSMKFGPAAMDKRRKIICSPFGGTSPLMIDADTREAEWITETTAFSGALSGCAYIHASDTGRIYMYPGRDYVQGRNALPHQGDIYVDSRPIIKAGDGFVVDTVVAMRDSFSFWSRWPSFAYESADSRFSCPAIKQTCCPDYPTSVPMPVDYYSTIAAGKTGFAFLPSVSGMLISHRVRRGRQYDRHQLQWSGVRGGGRAQQPPKTLTPVIYDDVLHLFDSRVKASTRTDVFLDDQYYTVIEDGKSSFRPRPFSHGSKNADYSIAACDNWAYWLPTEANDPLDESNTEKRNSPALNLITGSPTKSYVEPANWSPRVFRGFEDYVFSAGPSVSRGVLANGVVASSAGWVDSASFTRDSLRRAAWDGTSDIIYFVTHTMNRKTYAENGWTLELVVTSYDAVTGASSVHRHAFDLVGDKSTTAAIGPAVFSGGYIYVPLEKAPHLTLADLANNFYYFKITPGFDDDAQLISAANADSWPCWQGFEANGSLWFMHMTNVEYYTFIKLDLATGEANRPFDQGTVVQRPGGFESSLAPFNETYAVDSEGKYHFVPADIVSRAALTYVMDPVNETLVLRSYHEPKMPRKWNGSIQVNDVVYGVPSGANRVLAIDFTDPDNPVADQHEVTKFLGHAAWDRETATTGVGRVLNGIMHRSDPGENLGRSGVITKYGHAMAAPYAGRKGQTLEILRDGTMRMRVPGPFFDTNRKWGEGVLGDDGIIYAAPFDAPEILSIDPVNMAAGTSAANLTDELDGLAKYFCAVAMSGSGKAFMLPFSADTVLEVDYKHEEMKVFAPVMPGGDLADLEGEEKWMSKFSYSDDHFLIPYLHQKVGVFNSTTREFSFLDVESKFSDQLGDRRWRGAVEGDDGRYYCAPFDASDILCVDPRLRTTERISPELRLVGDNKWLHHTKHDGLNSIFMYGGSSSSVLNLQFVGDEVWGKYVDPDSSRPYDADQYFCARPVTLGADDDTFMCLDLFPRNGKLQQVTDRVVGFGVTVLYTDVSTIVPVNKDFAYYIPKGGDIISYTDTRDATEYKTFKATTRIPEADKYGRPAVINGVAYFPPNGSGAWLILEREGYLIDVVSGVNDVEGVTINEHCPYALKYGEDKVIAPASDGNYFLILDIKTRLTTKSSLGMAGSSWEGLNKDIPGSVGSDGTIYFAHINGIVAVKPSGAVSRPDMTIEVPTNGRRFVSVSPYYDTGRLCATWNTHYGTSNFIMMDIETGDTFASSRYSVSTNSLQINDTDDTEWVMVRTASDYAAHQFAYVKRSVDVEQVGEEVYTGNAYATPLIANRDIHFVRSAKGELILYNSRIQKRIPTANGYLSNAYNMGDDGYCGGYVRLNEDIVLVPKNATNFVIVSGWPSGALINFTANIENAQSYASNFGAYGAVIDMGDKVYCIPYNASFVGIITKGEDGTDSMRQTNFGLADMGESPKYNKAFKVGKFIMAIPEAGNADDRILVIDTEFDEAIFAVDTSNHLASGYGWFGKVGEGFVGVLEDRVEIHDVEINIESNWVTLEGGVEYDEAETDPTIPWDETDPDLRPELDTGVMADFRQPTGRDVGRKLVITFGIRYTAKKGVIGGPRSELKSSIMLYGTNRMYMSSFRLNHTPVIYGFDFDTKVARVLGVSGLEQTSMTYQYRCKYAADLSIEGFDKPSITLSCHLFYLNTGVQYSNDYVTRLDVPDFDSQSIAGSGYPPGWFKTAYTLFNADRTYSYNPITRASDMGKVPEVSKFVPIVYPETTPAAPMYLLSSNFVIQTVGGSAGINTAGVSFQFSWDEMFVLTSTGILYSAVTDRTTVYPYRFVAPEIGLKTGSGSGNLWYASAQKNGTTYVFPNDGISVLELTGASGYVNMMPTVPPTKNKYHGAEFISDTEVLLLPWTGTNMFAIYDIVERKITFETFGIDPELLQGVEKFKRAFLRNEGREVVVLPHRKNFLIIIDLETRTAEVRDLPVENMMAGQLQWGDWFERLGEYYGVPYNADYLVKLNVDDMTMERVTVFLDLSGREKWACGYPTAWGDIIFLPFKDDMCLYFETAARTAYRTGFDTLAAMAHLRPLGKVVRWWNNAELLPENSEKPGEDDTDVPPSSVEYDWFAVSTDNGVARYDRSAGNILGTPKQWGVYDNAPNDQYLDFIYAPASAKVIGIPHNARDILVISRGANDVSCAQSKMTPDLTVNYNVFVEESRDCNITYRLHGDNFMASAYTHEYDPVFVSGGAGINIIVDAFTGIMKLDPIYDIMEWNRPVYVSPMPGSKPVHLTLWENINALFSSVALGPDGCLYMFTSSARWGLVGRGISGANDKLFHPQKIVTFNTIFHKQPQYLKTLIPVTASSVTASGKIVVVAGEPVTYGKLLNRFVTKAWYDIRATTSRWRDLDDARGTTIEREKYWTSILDTGFHADAKALTVTSPFLNNR